MTATGKRVIPSSKGPFLLAAMVTPSEEHTGNKEDAPSDSDVIATTPLRPAAPDWNTTLAEGQPPPGSEEHDEERNRR